MKKNVAVVMGGFTEEFEISIKSGYNVMRELNRDSYNPYPVIITREAWYSEQAGGIKIPIDKSDFSVSINGDKVLFDVVFNTIHGEPGENGALQSYFDLIGMPYTSSGSYASALTYNKGDLLSVMRFHGLRTAKSCMLDRRNSINVDEVVATVGLPCFVKPNKAGSSFGISKVYKCEKLRGAIEMAFASDDEILVESFLEGTEVTVGVFTLEGEAKVLPMTEIISNNDFFDYEAKYQGASQEITPACIPKAIERKIERLATYIYGKLKMKGFVRSEFIIVDGEPHLLEVNTTPGLTDQSIIPQQAKEAGISPERLFDSVIQEALKS